MIDIFSRVAVRGALGHAPFAPLHLTDGCASPIFAWIDLVVQIGSLSIDQSLVVTESLER
jgi:hypothetical protein